MKKLHHCFSCGRLIYGENPKGWKIDRFADKEGNTPSCCPDCLEKAFIVLDGGLEIPYRDWEESDRYE